MDPVSRRRFLETAAAGVLAAAAPRTVLAQSARAALPVSFFSKPLPKMDAPRLGHALKSLGFAGVDLTVRPGGHVEPARVVSDLPPFVTRLRQEGLDVPMITTALVSDADPAARPTLQTAARLKIPYFKPGYYNYKFIDLRQEVDAAVRQLGSLAALSAQSGIQVGYHNHAGNVGGSVLDFADSMDTLDPKWAGYYFDVRHAVVEGGDAGWRTAFLRAAPRLKMIALKDFFWEKTSAGWQQRHCPMGEGMVDWKAFFAMLAKSGFQGPISLHIEYEIDGPTVSAREDNTLAAASRDLAFVNARLAEVPAGSAARAL